MQREPRRALSSSKAGSSGIRRPRGVAPRGFSNWDGVDGVWCNDDGEMMCSKERRADAERARRARNKERNAEARALEHELQPSNPKSHSALDTFAHATRLSCAEQPTEVRFPARKSAARCPAPPARNPGMARTCASARSHPWPTAPPPELWTVNRGQARTPPAARCTMRKQKKRRGPGRTPSRG